jgi:hypothetical protein
MPKKKTDPAQPALPGKAFAPGPASQPKRKLPTAAAVKEMGARFKSHAQALRDLLSDVQVMAEQNWPIADPDFDGNLSHQIVLMLEVLNHSTEGAEVVELDTTLATLIADVDAIADDWNPGKDQGAWVKQVLASPEAPVSVKPVGTPSKGDATKTAKK